MKSLPCGAVALARETCSADTPVRETPKPEMAKARPNPILTAIIHGFSVVDATLREIFDESAYQRFLDRSQLQSSPSSYAMFRQETEQAKALRPRCC
jgi:hypothetical protein